MNKIRIGTRGSALAVKQVQIIMDSLHEKYPELEFKIVKITTTGDKFLDVSLNKIGGKGLFIKEIEDALLKDEIDIAVHSMKDMPAFINESLTIAAYSTREDASDCLINNIGCTLEEMPLHSVIGTSSLRRTVQILALRSDLNIVPLRGNVMTRLRKLDEGQMDGIILATAGVTRLDLEKRIIQRFPKDKIIPAVCQGIIGIETKKSNNRMIDILKDIDSTESRISSLCERAFMKRLNGSCQIPLGALSQIKGDRINITGILGDMANLSIYKETLEGAIEDAENIGTQLAENIIFRLKK